MDKLTYVFIAGPYAGETHDYRSYLEIAANIARARAVAATLARAGVPFFCPHLNSAHFEVIAPDVPADFWYAMDNIFLRNATAVYLLEGWGRSAGALNEAKLALELHKTVYEPAGLDQLIDDWHRTAALHCEVEVVSFSVVSNPEPECCFEHSCPHHDGFVRDDNGEWFDPRDPREQHRFGL